MTSSMPSVSLEPVVILGGGIIGVSVAYHLSQRGVKSLVVDRAGIAAAASGKAGGFLARDWCDSSPVGKLARRSFDLHERMGKSLGKKEDYGYRKLDTLALVIEERKTQARQAISTQDEQYPSWLDGQIERSQVLGTRKTTAQVHPKLFTEILWRKAQENGASHHFGKVEDVKIHIPATGHPEIAAVIVDGKEIPAKNVVVAMGPWSGPLLWKLLHPSDSTEAQQTQKSRRRQSPRNRSSAIIKGQKAYSIILRPNGNEAENNGHITPHALFVNYLSSHRDRVDPEFYPRPDGSVYVCGVSESPEVPSEVPESITTNNHAVKRLRDIAGNVSTALSEEHSSLEFEQACYLPTSLDGLPIIGKVSSVLGAYVATGHSCWGILNAPITGHLMADLMIDGITEMNIDDFSPDRFLR